jgi:integrase
MELQARCGLRVGEVLGLRASDVNERKLIIRSPSQEVDRKWLSYRR